MITFIKNWFIFFPVALLLYLVHSEEIALRNDSAQWEHLLSIIRTTNSFLLNATIYFPQCRAIDQAFIFCSIHLNATNHLPGSVANMLLNSYQRLHCISVLFLGGSFMPEFVQSKHKAGVINWVLIWNTTERHSYYSKPGGSWCKSTLFEMIKQHFQGFSYIQCNYFSKSIVT